MRASSLALLGCLALAGCLGEDDESLTPQEARSVRGFFATIGATGEDATCLAESLVDQLGADSVAELPRIAEGDAGRIESEELGAALGAAIGKCETNPVHTDCFALFDSKADAREAASRAEAAGFDSAQVTRGSDRRGPRPAVTFSTGQSDVAAESIRAGFERLVERMGGRLGHPRDGCLEQPFFD